MKREKTETTTVPVSLLKRAADIIQRQQALLKELVSRLEKQ